jgi:hypothetical protein
MHTSGYAGVGSLEDLSAGMFLLNRMSVTGNVPASASQSVFI